MADISTKRKENTPEVICEIVAYRYCPEPHQMLVGEAELLIEVFGEKSETGTNLYSVRVDLLSAFNPDGQDVYAATMNNPSLKHALERTALDHYFHPPLVPVGIPRRAAEW